MYFDITDYKLLTNISTKAFAIRSCWIDIMELRVKDINYSILKR